MNITLKNKNQLYKNMKNQDDYLKVFIDLFISDVLNISIINTKNTALKSILIR